MHRLRSVAVATNLVLQLADSGPDILLTVPQRDTRLSRTDPASASVSADGRHVAFVSYARLVDADIDDRADIYVLDRLTGEVTLESRDGEDSPLRRDSGHPRLSADGRHLAFDGAVADGHGTPTVQVLLRDRTARTTTRLSRTADGRIPNGWSREPVISGDGSAVVFTSAATDLVPGRDENGADSDLYLYLMSTGEIRRISLDSRGRQHATGSSYAPSVSADGRHVAFVSSADLAEHEGGAPRTPAEMSLPSRHIYVRDLETGKTTRLSKTGDGEPANGRSWGPAVSGDGHLVAFTSEASNLVPRDRNRSADVFLHDRRTGVTTLVSRSAQRRSANGASINPAISNDGRFVAFQSDASDLVCAGRCEAVHEDINLVFDVFVFDRMTAATRRVSAGPTGGWMEESGGPALSADGTVIAFRSRHPTDAEDNANDFDLFVAPR